MTGVLIALGVAIVLLATILAALSAVYGPPWRASNRGESVIVCTRRPDDQALHGVLVRRSHRGVVLAAAAYLNPDGSATKVGDVWVPGANIAFVQLGVAPVDVLTANQDVTEPATVPLPALDRPQRLREPPAAHGR